jgi:hypothetical protein
MKITPATGTVVNFPGAVVRHGGKRCELCQHCRAEFSVWTHATHLYCHQDPQRVRLVQRDDRCPAFDWRKVVS